MSLPNWSFHNFLCSSVSLVKNVCIPCIFAFVTRKTAAKESNLYHMRMKKKKRNCIVYQYR